MPERAESGRTPARKGVFTMRARDSFTMRVRNGLHTRARLWLLGAAVAIAAVVVPAVTTDQTATAAAPAAPAQGSSTLDDQTELALTVYNSNIALVRDVRTLQLPRGTFDLQFMDIAATVNPATVHFRSLSEPRPGQRARTELRVRPARAGQAAAQVRRPRRHARPAAAGRWPNDRGAGHRAAPQLQQRARVADRQRDRHRPRRRSHPLPRASRQSLLTPDADLVAQQRWRRAAPRRGVLSRHQRQVERRLRADRRA